MWRLHGGVGSAALLKVSGSARIMNTKLHGFRLDRVLNEGKPTGMLPR